MPIKVVELHHHGIRIDPSDEAQDRAREFYSGLLGLEADEGRPDIPGVPGFWMYVGNGRATHPDPPHGRHRRVPGRA